MKKNGMSLRQKLLGLNIAIAVVAVSQFGLMAWRNIDGLTVGKERLARSMVEAYLDKIDRNLFERYGDVQAFSLSESARSGSPQRIVSFMNDMMGAYAPIYDAMMVVNSSGKVIAINTVDKGGKPLSSTSLLGKDYSGEEWFKKAMANEIEPGTSFVEDPHVDADMASLIGGSGRVMNFTAPIRDKETGKVLGVWTNRMSWDDVVVTITKEEMSKVRASGLTDVFAFVLDSKGRYIIHPEAEKELKAELPGFAEETARAKEKTEVMIDKVDEPYFKGKMVGALTASKGYSIYPGKGWFAEIRVDAFDSAMGMAWFMIALGILLQVAGLIAGWWMIGRAVNAFDRIIADLGEESTKVTKASYEITSSSNSLASASTEQASALQETASSIEEMSAMIKKSSENAMKSREIASKSQDAANKGKARVDDMITAIKEINTSNDNIMRQVEASNREITDIVKVITEIGNKTKVINDIVFQTKLLSFNASVEAARAGEHGKGFAVVAEEVGNLAQMSGNAAKEIGDMLAGSIHKVESIVTETKNRVERLIGDGRAKVESGTQVAHQCGETLEEVVKNVSEVNLMIEEISTATTEQSQGVSEITKAMNQLDQVTHQNASVSQATASSAASLSRQSDTLLGVVDLLKDVVFGTSSEHPGSEPMAPAAASPAKERASSPAPAPHKSPSTSPKKSNEPPVQWKPFPTSDGKASAPAHMKKAVGGVDVPSEADPRFKDV